jgi:hypothetical protein
VLVLGSAAAISYGVARNMTKSREAGLAKKVTQIGRQYQQRVQPIISPLGQTVAPTGFDALPQLKEAIDNLDKGAITAKDAANTAKSVAVQAKLAYEKLDGIDVAKLFGGNGFTADYVLFALNSKTKIVSGLKMFEQAAQMVVLATALDGDAQKQLLADANNVLQIATDTFKDGYADYVQVQAAAHILSPTAPALPGTSG